MSIPHHLPSSTKLAPAIDRDRAALILVGYLSTMLDCEEIKLPEGWRQGLRQRIDKVRQTQGLFATEAAARIREAAAPIVPNKVKEAI